jgi:hypothetical protein
MRRIFKLRPRVLIAMYEDYRQAQDRRKQQR